jgi:hypothetical protein
MEQDKRQIITIEIDKEAAKTLFNIITLILSLEVFIQNEVLNKEIKDLASYLFKVTR